MRVPRIQGVIDRRILANYRVDPEAIARQLPPPFRPKLFRGYAIAGVCLIRLKGIRPAFFPLPFGLRSENAAHRIAVEWGEQDAPESGVFIPRRDTGSTINALVGGRVFPGVHHLAKFSVDEGPESLSISMDSKDDAVRLRVEAQVADSLNGDSIFGSLKEASSFFEQGSIGYSVTREARRYDGLELCCQDWQVEPLEVQSIESSFFDSTDRFPPGSLEFDSALLMRGVRHEWRDLGQLCCG